MANNAEIDARDRARIAKAQYFVVSLYMGLNGSWVKKTTRTLAEAQAEAAAMDAELGVDAGGRRSMIYAVDKRDLATFVPKHLYQPQTGDTPMPNPTEKFASKFSAQRSAKRAGYAPEACDFTKTEEGGWVWTAKAVADTEPPKQSIDIEKSTKARKPRRITKDEAAHLFAKGGKRAAIENLARSGVLPDAPDFSAETHKRFRPTLEKLIAMAAAGDLAGLRAEKINPISSSPKALDKYRNLCVMALEAKAAA